MYAVSARSCSRTFSIPSALRYSTAAPRPTASAIGGVPASNLYGSSFHVVSWKSTDAIMSPPVKNGCICSSSSSRPCSTPMPVGPSALCPVHA